MANERITNIVSEILRDFLKENELELYNVEYLKEDGDWYLRVYIEKPEPKEGEEEKYVDTDECEKVSHFLSDKLDEEDPIEQNYYLEVSSPGMDRALIREDDYRRFKGRFVDVTLKSAFEERKKFDEVTLIGLEGAEAENSEDASEKAENIGKKLIIEHAPLIPSKNKGAKPKYGEPVRYEIPFEIVSKVRLSVIF